MEMKIANNFMTVSS